MVSRQPLLGPAEGSSLAGVMGRVGRNSAAGHLSRSAENPEYVGPLGDRAQRDGHAVEEHRCGPAGSPADIGCAAADGRKARRGTPAGAGVHHRSYVCARWQAVEREHHLRSASAGSGNRRSVDPEVPGLTKMHGQARGRLRRDWARQSADEREYADHSACPVVSDRDEDAATHPASGDAVAERLVLTESLDETLEYLGHAIRFEETGAHLVEATPTKDTSSPIGTSLAEFGIASTLSAWWRRAIGPSVCGSAHARLRTALVW